MGLQYGLQTTLKAYPMTYDLETAESAITLIDLAHREDLSQGVDLSSEIMIDPEATGSAQIVARETGIACGLCLITPILDRFNANVEVEFQLSDGDKVEKDQTVVEFRGNAQDILRAERTVLNFIGRLSGIATLTNNFMAEIQGTGAKVFDTRKTTPGWRRLEKYAVRCGGGENHRMGLYDAILIKDNHLCISKEKIPDWSGIVQLAFKNAKNPWPEIIIQIEVDTLSQLETILPLEPNIVLLDNMSLHDLRTAVDIRANLPVLLEASGGVNLKSIREIAETGVERISVGALTHSAINFDWGMDWQSFDRLLTN